MTKLNKAVKFIHSLIVIAVVSVISVSATEITELNVKSGYETELLEILGIIDGDNLQEEVTRVDFIQMLSKMTFYGEGMDYTNIPTQTNPFLDVENYHYAASNIERFVQLGIVKGDGNSYLRIDDNITYTEAYAMMLNAAGYSKVAESYGEYPHNYNRIAAEKELAENIDTSKTITKEIAAKLLVNLMDVEVIYTTISDGVNYEKGEKFMSARLGINYAEGILESAGNLQIIDKNIGVNNAYINGNVMENKFPGAEELVGCRVKYYYDEDDCLIYAVPRKNYELSFVGEDVEDYSNRIYTYANNTSKPKKAKVDNAVILVYNGSISDVYSHFIPAYGDVRLIDNDADGDYDVIFANDYEVGWIDSVINDGEILTFVKPLNSGDKSVSLETYDDYEIYDELGVKLDFSALAQNQLITIQRFKNEKLRIVINSKTVTGTVSRVYDEDKYTEITIDDEIYRMSKNVYIKLWDGKIGTKATVYFDSRGQVSAIAGITDDTWMYAFVISAREFTSDETGLPAIKLKILSQSGAVESHIIDDEKIRVDGIKDEISDISNKFTGNQLIRYMTKDGKITAVDFAKDLALTTENNKNNNDSADQLLRRVAGKFVYRGSPKIFKRNTKDNELDGEIIPRNADIPVFHLPAANELETASDKAFYVKNVSNISGNTGGHFEGFSINAEDYYCDAIIAYGINSFSSSSADVPIIVSSITESINDVDEIVYTVSGYEGNKEVSFMTSAVMEKNEIDAISRGDIIRAEMDSEGRMVKYKIIYSKNGGGVITDTKPNSNKFDEGNLERYALGYAADISDGIIKFCNLDDGYAEFYRVNNISTIIVFDSSKRKDSIVIGNVNDIITKKTSASNCDKIIIFTHYTEPRCMWVIK